MGISLPSLKTIRELFYVPAPVPSFTGRKVLITGAASGIGKATAVEVAKRGGQLVLTDVQTGALDQIVAEINGSGGQVLYHRPGDITDYDWVAAFARDVSAEVGVMDVVMNIAGVSAWGTVERLEHRQWRKMVEVNLMGPIHIIECFVPPMIQRGKGGQLVNVSSAAGLLALPWHAAYSASKFGLRGVSEVLRFDLRRHGIGVSLVCPGAVATPLVDTVEINGLDRTNPVIEKQISGFHRISVTPEQAAASICKGVVRNKYMVYTSFDTRFGYWWARKFALPYEVIMRIANNRFDQLARVSALGAQEPGATGSQASVPSRHRD